MTSLFSCAVSLGTSVALLMTGEVPLSLEEAVNGLHESLPDTRAQFNLAIDARLRIFTQPNNGTEDTFHIFTLLLHQNIFVAYTLPFPMSCPHLFTFLSQITLSRPLNYMVLLTQSQVTSTSTLPSQKTPNDHEPKISSNLIHSIHCVSPFPLLQRR